MFNKIKSIATEVANKVKGFVSANRELTDFLLLPVVLLSHLQKKFLI